MGIRLLLLILPLLLFSSCDKLLSIVPTVEEKPFKFIDFKKSGFRKIGDAYQYEFVGSFKNVSEYIFDEVYCSAEVQLHLDNGNVITKSDYRSGMLFVNFGGFEKIWKPNEIRLIKKFESTDKPIRSDFIPMRYKEYNITKVEAVLTFDTKDLVNRKKKSYTVLLNVTEQWNKTK